MRGILVLVASLAALAASPDYDPVRTLPDSYKLQFENEWVKVVRVRYAPHAKLPAHAHTSHASAYVYLNDAAPVIFRHVGEKKFQATRPATKAGSFRVFRGIDEIHEVENTGDVPSEFLRVEFKTEPEDVETLKGRFHREPGNDSSSPQVQFDNAQVRISRLACAAGKKLSIATVASEPALLIDLTTNAGAERWIPAGRSEVLEADASREWLRFDFKTPPQRASSAQNR